MTVAFVAPFYGGNASGGAESECRNTAVRLAAGGMDVEVLTTCLLDLQHNLNVHYHPRGTTWEDGVCVRRFRAEPVDPEVFLPLNEALIAGAELSSEDEERFMAANVNSFDLLRHIAATVGDYDWMCFIPYLFGTTVFGARLAARKSVLIPCLHDEGYARLRSVRRLFDETSRIVFHTSAEARLAEQLYGDVAPRSVVLGEGVTAGFDSDASRFRAKYGLGGAFILYVGRKSREKNTHLLLRSFAAYKRRAAGATKLVLMGPGGIPPWGAEIPDVVDLGFVEEQDKRDAYSAAALLCQPSLNESFSLVMMEAWACGTPCLVSAGCAVTREHVAACGGGLYFDGPAEFACMVEYMLENDDARDRRGA